MPTRWAAFSGCVASIGALVYAFALQGSIKEIAFLPLLVILGNLILDRDLRSSTRALALVGGFAAAGSIGSIGLPALGWILPLGGVALLANWKRFGGERGLKQLAVMAGVVAVALVLMTLPRAEGAINQLNLARDLSQTNTALANDPGNLRRPIGKEQSLGAWFGSSHLVAPQQREGTIVALGIIFVLFLLGGLSFLLRRRWLWIAWAGTLFGIWYVLTWRGTMWIDAKLVMLASNAVLMVALYGAWQLRDQLRPKLGRALAYGGAGVIALSVFASAGAQYLATTILPTDRYNELSVINERFAGQGPAFTPDFDENGLFVLRDIGVTGPGYAYTDPGYTIRRDGTSVGYGGSADIDNIIDRRYADYPLVIQRRGPARSRPGSDYDLVLRGEFYESYKRNETQVVEHLQVGDPAVAVSVPYCKDILAIARRGDADDLTLLAAVPRAPVKFLAPTDVKITGDLAEPHPFGEIKGTGTIEFSADVKPGQKLWWNGAITRPIDVLVDGQRVGSFKYNVSGQGAIAGPLALPEGKHEITLKRGNGSLAPGGLGGGSFFGVTLAPADESEVIEVDRKRAEAELCGRQIDWLELVRPTD